MSLRKAQKRLLLISRDNHLVPLLDTLLKADGFKVVVAEGGLVEIFQAFRRTKPAAVLLDSRLSGGVSAAEVISKIRRARRRALIIVLNELCPGAERSAEPRPAESLDYEKLRKHLQTLK